jgi:hypothetical protein
MRAPAFLLAILLGCDGGGSTSPDGGASLPPDGGGGTGRVTLTDVTPPGGSPLQWVAFNDGDGPWQTLDGASGVYSFSVKSGRYGLAFVCSLPRGFGGEVVHATAAELTALTIDCGAPPPVASHRLSGKITGLPAAARVEVQGGRGAESFQLQQIDPPATAYQASLPADTYDLAAISYLDDRPGQLLLRRDVAIAADVVVDLDFAQGLPLLEQPLSLTGDGASAPGLVAVVSLITKRAQLAWGDLSGQRPTGYPALPASALAAGEVLELDVSSTTGQLPAFSVRGIILGLRQPKAVEVALPPLFSPELSVTAAASPRPRVSFTAYPGALYYQLVAGQFTAGRTAQWLCIFSAAWLGAEASYQLPDFSGARGYRAEFGLLPQAAVDIEADAVTSSRDLSRTLNDDPATRDGSRLTYARKGDHLTPR